jgi:hypothetical protein
MWCMPVMRPEQTQNVLDQMVACGLSTPGIVIANGPGFASIKLPDAWDIYYPPQNLGLCGSLNLFYRTFPDCDWYGIVCDDEFVFTDGFDKILPEAAGRWKISHGNDGWKSQDRIHTYSVTGGSLIRAIGWWALPGLWHWYFDDVWEMLAADLNIRVWCQDVKTEHRHHMAGKAEFDATYKLGESRSVEDRHIFETWKSTEYPRLRERLRTLMK